MTAIWLDLPALLEQQDTARWDAIERKRYAEPKLEPVAGALTPNQQRVLDALKNAGPGWHRRNAFCPTTWEVTAQLLFLTREGYIEAWNISRMVREYRVICDVE